MPVATPAELANRLLTLGAPPPGHPAEARACATQLLARADELEQHRARLRRDADVKDYEGGAAQRHTHDVAWIDQQVGHRATELRTLAQQLASEAAALEQRQHAWRGRARGLAAGVESLLGPALRSLGWKMP